MPSGSSGVGVPWDEVFVFMVKMLLPVSCKPVADITSLQEVVLLTWHLACLQLDFFFFQVRNIYDQ